MLDGSAQRLAGPLQGPGASLRVTGSRGSFDEG